MTRDPSIGGACVRCGYDLTGLHDGAACPECGTPVLRSRRGDLLVFADASVLRRVRAGLWVLVAASAVAALASLTSTIAGSPPLAGQTPSWLWQYVLSPLWLALAAVEAAGWWLATAYDAADESRSGTLRNGVRALALASLLTAGGSLLWSIVLPPGSWVFLVAPWFDRAADITLFILGTHFLRRLAQRSSPAGPVRMATLLLGAGVGVRLVGAARSGWYLFSRFGLTRTPEFFDALAWSSVVNGLAGLGVLVLQGVLLLTLLGRVNAALASQRPEG